MRQQRYQVFLETSAGRKPAGFRAFAHEEPAQVALQTREKGWIPYRVRFEPEPGAWIVSVIDWKRAA
jgi:hypothetical protein